MQGEHLGARLTVGIDGSFGTLQYALLALTTSSAFAKSKTAGNSRHDPLTENMLSRGFRRACNSDYADIVLKAQPADGSVLCRSSTGGLLSVWFDDNLVWSEHFDPRDAEAALWLKAAQTREVTLIGGDRLLISGTDVDPTAAADKRTLMMAKIPTVWT